MSTKVFPGVLMLGVLVISTAWAADPTAPNRLPYQAAPAPVADEMPSTTSPGLSSWITYSQCDCCGPLGGDGPIEMELYFRTGATIPVHGDIISHRIEPGIFVAGGGRSLFFNASEKRAWTVDLGVSHMYNNGNRPNLSFPPGVSTFDIRALHRTTFNLALGQEWYLIGCAHSDSWNWRTGMDVGGRFGGARLDLNTPSDPTRPFRRTDDAITGVFVSVHTDLEIPCGCCTFQVGLRGEWDDTYMNFIPVGSDSVQDANIMMTLGVRY